MSNNSVSDAGHAIASLHRSNTLCYIVTIAKVHLGGWCERCNWLFVTEKACVEHVQRASRHWLCQICNEDKLEEDKLEEDYFIAHQAELHHWCYHC